MSMSSYTWAVLYTGKATRVANSHLGLGIWLKLVCVATTLEGPKARKQGMILLWKRCANTINLGKYVQGLNGW